jgi:PTH1 family peptidyl-tRNA hydrolase
MKLVVGLGNPGEKYIQTRHNLGFEVVDHLVAKLLAAQPAANFWEMKKELLSEIGQLEFAGEKLLLAKPQTYMNNSGQAVAILANFYKIDPTDIIIVHDELDLRLGQIKIRQGGAAAGHHGVESIIEKLGTDNFMRVRLGIGNLKTNLAERDGEHVNMDHYVVEPFGTGEKNDVKHLIKKAVDAIEVLLEKGLADAQNRYH